MYSICLTVGSNSEIHKPPAGHLEFQAFHTIIAVPQIFSHARTGWKSMSVLRHVALYGDRGILNRRTVSAFHVQSPLMHLIDGDAPWGGCIGHTKQAVIRLLGGRIIQIGWGIAHSRHHGGHRKGVHDRKSTEDHSDPNKYAGC